MKKDRLRMTVELDGMEYAAEGSANMTLDRLFGRIIVPLVLSMSYSADRVAKLFVDGLPSDWDSAYDEPLSYYEHIDSNGNPLDA
jgi:hypothetical protein